MKKEMKLLESYRNVQIVSDDYFDRQYKALLINYYENTEVITTYIYIYIYHMCFSIDTSD